MRWAPILHVAIDRHVSRDDDRGPGGMGVIWESWGAAKGGDSSRGCDVAAQLEPPRSWGREATGSDTGRTTDSRRETSGKCLEVGVDACNGSGGEVGGRWRSVNTRASAAALCEAVEHSSVFSRPAACRWPSNASPSSNARRQVGPWAARDRGSAECVGFCG